MRPDTTSEYFLVDIPEKGRILRFLKRCKLGKTELTHRLAYEPCQETMRS